MIILVFLFGAANLASAGETGDRSANFVPDAHIRVPRANKEYLRPCYFTNWAQYRKPRAKYVPEDYVAGLCTHILFAFGWMNDDYTVRAFDPADLPNDWAGQGMFKRLNALKAKDPALKTLLSIGGWSFGTRLFKEMSKTAGGRKTFIDSAIKFARQWDFDGIDIDWEYPSGAEDVQQFTALVNEFHAAMSAEASAFNKPRLLITAAVAAGEATLEQGYDIPNIANALDFILLMNYDFWGAWDGVLGMNSPLYGRPGLSDKEKNWNIDWAAKYWADNGMPREKIIIGIATYGRGWTLANANNYELGTDGNTKAKITEYVQEAGVAAYYEFCEMLAKGATRYWHTEHQVPYLVQGDQFWSYDDEESTLIKVNYVKKEGFGGAFVWTLDFDDFNAKCSNSKGQQYPLISIIAKELGGVTIPKKSVPAPPPQPVTTVATTIATGAPGGTKISGSVTFPTPPPYTVRPSVIPTQPPTNPRLCDGSLDGFHGIDNVCRKFLLCLRGVSYSMACPDGLFFSRLRGFCTQPNESGCVESQPVIATTRRSPTVTSPQTITSTIAGYRYKCEADGFFPDLDHCAKFWRCVAGTPYHFDCPAGLSFDKEALQCLHYNDKDCNKKLTKPIDNILKR